MDMDFGEFIRKITGSDEPMKVVNETEIMNPKVKEMCEEIRNRRRESRDALEKIKRNRLLDQLAAKDIWDHAAALFGYQSIGDLHDDNKSVSFDVDKNKVYLNTTESNDE